MQYVNFPKLNIKVSKFGMGCMRLPKKTNDTGKIVTDETESIKMIRYAAENGVNYFDTAYAYNDSEATLGKALGKDLRKNVYIASKSPLWSIEKSDDFDTFLNESLKRLDTSYIDFYLLHGLDKESWKKVKKLKLIDKLNIAKKEGKIKYESFSFHDDVDLLKEIIDSYSWDTCLIQLNFLCDSYQAGVEGLKYAASKGVELVIMEPLFGGRLGRSIPPDIIDKWNDSGIKRTPAEWAFRWFGNFPEAKVILSGVSSMEQLREDIEIFEKVFPATISEKEIIAYKEVKKLYEKKLKVNCTGCSYCMPCSSGVDIPGVLWNYNSAFMGDPKISKEAYINWLCSNKMDASQCSECGQCEELCPQDVDIMDQLKAAHKFLTSE